MIEKTFQDFDHSSDEGRMLLASIVILTTIKQSDIDDKKFGSTCGPHQILDTIRDLANRIYYEKDWEIDQIRIKRIEKITNIEK